MRRRALVAALSTLVGLVVCAPQAAALPDGLALAPPMGFDNWNTTHCRAEFNEAMVKGIADKFVDSGLKSAGYRYVNIDDCWAKQRYRKMRDALQATGRPIVFSICEWGQNRPWEWASDTGHLWRTTGDINDTWAKTRRSPAPDGCELFVNRQT
jgi:hypothetical protein